MGWSDGYRLKAGKAAELSALLEAFRAEALRLLARRYGALVAARAAAFVDMRAVGLAGPGGDPIAEACEEVRKTLRTSGGIQFAEVNCAVDLHFVGDAVLATFVHGNDGYRKAWESMRGVVRWGWSRERPDGISEISWEKRRKYWEAVAARKGLGDGMRFLLVRDSLPKLGWGAVRRQLPTFESRVSVTADALARSNPDTPRAELVETVSARIERELSKESFAASARPAARTKPADAKPQHLDGSTVPAPKASPDTAAARMRATAAKARQDRSAARKPRPEPERAASIDHADIVVSSDGRTFVAAPYVGLDPQNRVFLQVGDSHVAVSQGGLQYGYVTGVQKSAIDHLRQCRTVTLVEVDRRDGRRLLRARHVAIVSDISLGENINVSLGSFRRPKPSVGDREFREWDSRD